MVDRNLKPGLYIQRGESVKAITTSMLPNGDFVFGGNNPSPEKLASAVGFVYGALGARRAEMDIVAEVTKWMLGDNEQDSDMLGFDIWDEMPRIDTAIQLHSRAYYFKNTTLGNGIVLQWLDPNSIKPDKDSIDSTTQQYTNYLRRVSGGRTIPVSADDLIVIQQKGMRELSPMSSAGMATSLAGQILYSMDSTIDDLYDRNFMPIQLIHVPQGTSTEQKERVESRFKRLFSRFSGTVNKTIAVERGPAGDTISVTPISLSPDNLELTATRDAMADQILFAHGVPISSLRTNSNRDSSTKSIGFTRSIVARANMIARTINADKDVQRQRLELVVNAKRLEAYQAAELQKAEALQRLTGAPIIAVNEARELLEYEPMPGHDEIVLPQQSGFGQLPVPPADVPDATPSKAWDIEYKACRNYVRNGKHRKRAFNANELSRAEIATVIQELDPDWAMVVSRGP